MIKSPPYQIEFGTKNQEPPPFISSISDVEIVLGGAPWERKNLGFGDVIKIKPSDENMDSEELLSVMLKLNKLGFSFGYDYKTHLCPSDYMKQLLCSDRLLTSFKEISWKGPGLWFLTTYEYE